MIGVRPPNARRKTQTMRRYEFGEEQRCQSKEVRAVKRNDKKGGTEGQIPEQRKKSTTVAIRQSSLVKGSEMALRRRGVERKGGRT